MFLESKGESERFGHILNLMSIQKRSRLPDGGSKIDGAHATQGIWVRFQTQFDLFSWDGEARMVCDFYLKNKHTK